MPMTLKRKGSPGPKGDIAVVEVSGAIGGKAVRVPVYTRLLDDIQHNRRYRAVVLDVDSPGGAAAASEALHYQVNRLNAVKPVVCYIRGMGASGAYLMACASHKIVALPNAMVGSIGVIYVRPIMETLLERLGVSVTVHKGGHLKDMGAFWRTDTEEEQDTFRKMIAGVHDDFIAKVAACRNMTTTSVTHLATGAVFRGATAKAEGLVDEVGDFQDAISIAASLGNTKERYEYMRPPRSLLSKLTTTVQSRGSLEILTQGASRLMSGGLYMLPASHLLTGEEG